MIQKLVPFCVCFLIITSDIQSQTKAHEKSKFAIIDPTYSSSKSMPISNIKQNSVKWIYGSAELETWRLQLLMARKDSAKLDVGYPGVYHKPSSEGSFQLSLPNPLAVSSIKFRAVGAGKLYINENLVAEFQDSKTTQTVLLKKQQKISTIRFDLVANGNPPALLIEEKWLSTAQKNWLWKSPQNEWTWVTHYPQNNENLPPHLIENPSVLVKPEVYKNKLYDFGRELFGYVIIKSIEKPVMVVGESEKEALDIENKRIEQTLEMVKLSNGTWKSKVPLAFRYVYSENKTLDEITCEGVYYPTTYRGAFACSDSMLTKIWMNSAYTLRLCMHDFLLDGMKRDRLPWTGDLAMSMLVNSFTFGDAELVRRSLVTLGRKGIKEKDINGIIDYSLWWIIAQDQYQLYYADREHLVKEWSRIKDALEVLKSRSDENGFLKVKKDDWLFIDWVKQEKWTALQIMWWWAQRSAIQLANRMGEPTTADEWKERSDKLKTQLFKNVWDEKEQVWVSGKDTPTDKTRHPNFMAIVSGIVDKSQFGGIKNLLENDTVRAVGTPYMAGFEMMARAKLGNIDYTLQKITDYWGGMMARGATSFWEAYDPNQTDSKQYAYYGRPYAKSLCHAWSAGPAAVLPSQILGIHPLTDGWERFTINPNLGSLKWVNVSVPTKSGNIIVDIEQKNIQITVPVGTELFWKNKTFNGPQIIKDTL